MITTTHKTLFDYLANSPAIIVPIFKQKLLTVSAIDASSQNNIWKEEFQSINNILQSESLYNGRIITHSITIHNQKVLLVGVVIGHRQHFIDPNTLKKYLLIAIHRCLEKNIHHILIPMSPKIGMTRQLIKEFLNYNILPENAKIILYSRFGRI